MNENNYDVVADALQKYRHMLWKLTEQYMMNADMFNAMDQVRLDQIDQLDKAINERKQPKRQWVALTDEEFDELDKEELSLREFVQAIDDRLKEKNT